MIKIRFYTDQDYDQLANLYRKSREFKLDEVTDSQENLLRKITKDPESIMIAEDNSHIIGSL